MIWKEEWEFTKNNREKEYSKERSKHRDVAGDTRFGKQ